MLIIELNIPFFHFTHYSLGHYEHKTEGGLMWELLT